jgi:putative membrane protein
MQTLIEQLDEDRIREAVQRAEERTAGEIVPVVVPRSASYEVVTWRGATIAALLALIAAMLTLQFYDGWGLAWLYTPWGVVLTALASGTVGAVLATYVPPLQRLLAGGDLLDETVHRRALQSFVEEEVFDTRDRTGILLFVSLREHRIEVLGDTGINEQVEPDDWAEVVARIRRGIRNDNLTEGLVEAIAMCGRLLERRGVGIRPDDENELSNTVRTPDTPDDEAGGPGGAPDGSGP